MNNNKLIYYGFKSGFLEKSAGISQWWSELETPAKGMLIGAPIGAGFGGLGGYFLGPEDKKLLSTLIGGIGGGGLGAGIGGRIGSSIQSRMEAEEKAKEEEGKRQELKGIQEKLFTTEPKNEQQIAEQATKLKTQQEVQQKLFEAAEMQDLKKYQKEKSIQTSAAKNIDDYFTKYEKLIETGAKTGKTSSQDLKDILSKFRQMKLEYSAEGKKNNIDVSEIISEIDNKIRDIEFAITAMETIER